MYYPFTTRLLAVYYHLLPINYPFTRGKFLVNPGARKHGHHFRQIQNFFQVMLDAVQNHCARIVVIDELRDAREVEAARTIAIT